MRTAFKYLQGILVSLAAIPASVSAMQSSPEPFLPEIVSVAASNDEYVTFSPSGDTIFFTRRSGRENVILWTHRSGGSWRQPEVAAFSGRWADSRPFYAPDGRSVFFASNRPDSGDQARRDLDIFRAERTANGWSEPVRLGGTVNTAGLNETHPTVARNGDLYFAVWGGDPNDVRVARRTGSGYSASELLPAPVNTGLSDSHPYIDPDQRFLLFARDHGDDGGDQIYLSIRDGSGWGIPVAIDAANGPHYDYSPKVGPGNRLYFTRTEFTQGGRPGDIMSIDACGVPSLQPFLSC